MEGEGEKEEIQSNPDFFSGRRKLPRGKGSCGLNRARPRFYDERVAPGSQGTTSERP